MKEKTSTALITVLWNNYIFLDFFTKLVTIILFTYYFYFLFSNRYLVLVSKEVDGSRFARLSAEKYKNHRKVLCVYQPTEIRVKFRQYEYAAFQYNIISCQVKSTANWFSKHLHVCKKKPHTQNKDSEYRTTCIKKRDWSNYEILPLQTMSRNARRNLTESILYTMGLMALLMKTMFRQKSQNQESLNWSRLSWNELYTTTIRYGSQRVPNSTTITMSMRTTCVKKQQQSQNNQMMRFRSVN